MKQNFITKSMACCGMLLVAAGMQAANYPKYPVQTLADGQTYVLANLAQPVGYMCRTTWDNALRIQDKATFGSEYGVQLTAHFDQEKNLCISPPVPRRYLPSRQTPRMASRPPRPTPPTPIWVFLPVRTTYVPCRCSTRFLILRFRPV